MTSRLLPVLALIFSVGIFVGYIRPTWNGEIAAAKAAIASDDRALAAASTYTVKKNELASERAAISADNLTKLSALLPDSVDNVGLILDLNALAARSGVQLSNIDVQTDTTGKTPQGPTGPGIATNPVGSVDLSLSAIGTYAGFQAFLAGIEHSDRILDVEDLLVRGSDTGVYTYKLTVRLYWLR